MNMYTAIMYIPLVMFLLVIFYIPDGISLIGLIAAKNCKSEKEKNRMNSIQSCIEKIVKDWNWIGKRFFFFSFLSVTGNIFKYKET